MLQDIFPYYLDNHFENVKPEENDFVMVVKDRNILVLNSKEVISEETVFPRVKDFGMDRDYIYLFSIRNRENDFEERYFLILDELEELDSFSYIGVRELPNLKQHRVYAANTAKHLKDWYKDTKYCGRCGEKLSAHEKERAMKCPKCGYTIYPRIMPAVIVGVINGERLLLTRYQRGYQHNALVAGFTEIGETLEETVQREVMEEAGIKVKNIRYYKSQPWGMANDILVGYYCEVDGDDTIHMDAEELKYAEWVQRDEIVLQPQSYSLTNEMMKMFKEGKIK